MGHNGLMGDMDSTEHQQGIMSAYDGNLVENSQETAVIPTQDSLLLLG